MGSIFDVENINLLALIRLGGQGHRLKSVSLICYCIGSLRGGAEGISDIN